ncbi:MAG: hypothetical protein IPO14_04360 [Saprospiraceae bacterium]|nr:hypothetical protein [Saprospiraceae bacterium]
MNNKLLSTIVTYFLKTKGAFRAFFGCFFLLLGQTYVSAQGLVVNEISQGPSANQEWAELVVVGGTSGCETVDLRGWIIDDNNGDFNSCGLGLGAISGSGIAPGHIRFANVPYWSAIPVGTIILIYDNTWTSAPGLNTDYCDFLITFPMDGTVQSTYFEATVDRPTTPAGGNCTTTRTCPNGVGSATLGDPTYIPSNYLTTPSFGSISGIMGLANIGDAFQVRTPTGAYYHGLSYGITDPNPSSPCPGAPFGNSITGGPDGLHVSNIGGGDRGYAFLNTTDDNYRAVGNFSTLTPASSQTPGSPNNCSNARWIWSMRKPRNAEFITAPTVSGPSWTCNSRKASSTSLCFPASTVIAMTPPCSSGISYTYQWSSSDPSVAAVPAGAMNFTTASSINVSAVGSGTADIEVIVKMQTTLTFGGVACPVESTLNYAFPIVVNSFTATAAPVDATFCAGASFQLMSSAGSTRTWSGPGGYTSSFQNPTRTYITTAMSGTYCVTVTAVSGCKSTSCVVITVGTNPTAVAGPNVTACSGADITLNSSGLDWEVL